MRYFISQLQQDDCGFAAFKMMLASLYHQRDVLFLPNPKQEGNYTFFELQQYGKEYGVSLIGYQTQDLQTFSCPFLALIDQGNNRLHYLVIDRVTTDDISYRDPALGKKKVHQNTFFSYYTGYVLVPKQYEKKKIQKRRSFFSFHYVFFIFYFFLSLCFFLFLPIERAFVLSFALFFLYEQLAKRRIQHRLIQAIPCYFQQQKKTKERYRLFLEKVRTFEENPFIFVQTCGILWLFLLYGRYTGVSFWQFFGAIIVAFFLAFFHDATKKEENKLEKAEDRLFHDSIQMLAIKKYQKRIKSYFQKNGLLHGLAYFILFVLSFLSHGREGNISLSLLMTQFIFLILFVEKCQSYLAFSHLHEKRILAYLYLSSFYEGKKRRVR